MDLPAGTPTAAALLAALAAGPATQIAGPRCRPGLPLGCYRARPASRSSSLPAAEILRLGAAAARTLREVQAGGIGGRAVGQRALRDALLDHVPVTVEAQGHRVGVPQRLVQAVVRMGFVPASSAAGGDVTVLVLPGWVGLAGGYGTAWWRRVSRLTLTPLR